MDVEGEAVGIFNLELREGGGGSTLFVGARKSDENEEPRRLMASAGVFVCEPEAARGRGLGGMLTAKNDDEDEDVHFDSTAFPIVLLTSKCVARNKTLTHLLASSPTIILSPPNISNDISATRHYFAHPLHPACHCHALCNGPLSFRIVVVVRVRVRVVCQGTGVVMGCGRSRTALPVPVHGYSPLLIAPKTKALGDPNGCREHAKEARPQEIEAQHPQHGDGARIHARLQVRATRKGSI
ncbi:hypothetical protein CVT25_001701 [Psilocybe cyanescens]|uniref:Uncharacterized protein n=1 Tax=Psilocybe cyanescens TaxID=93625 RepID=A0A409XHJ9_PSICY|nr:hypothetical protein CVT25_001701 [Psilocybe cyanescens]